MDVYAQIVEKIIKQQETIIGPVAIEQAEHIPNLDVDWEHHKVAVKGDGKKVVDELIEQYKQLFGRISVEVCKEATHTLLAKMPPQEVPSLLK